MRPFIILPVLAFSFSCTTNEEPIVAACPTIESLAYRAPDGSAAADPTWNRAFTDSTGSYSGTLWLAPGTEVPMHIHEGYEITWILCGSVTLTIGGETRTYTEGMRAVMPPMVEHAAVVGDRGATAAQVYAPGSPGLRFYDWDRS